MFHLFTTAKSVKSKILSMKKLLTFSLFLYSVALMAQPAYDNCETVFQLGVAPNCPVDTIFNNVNATESDIGFDNFPPCFNGGTPARDIWISFVASDTIFDYAIELTACPDPLGGFTPILQPQIAVYRGDCGFDELQLLDCASAEVGESNLMFELDGLTPGLEYFLRINDWSVTATPNWGSFKLCVKERDPVVIIGETDFSEACTGEIYDSGGPDGDYQNNEDFTFTICPSDFHNCLLFSLEFFNLENSNPPFNVSDALIFYDGPDTNSPIIGQTSGGDSEPINGGGVCYQVAATSGCMTLQFISDGDVTFEGFHGFWECSQDECAVPEPIQVTPLANNQQIIDNITTPQTVVTIDTIICPDGAIGTFLTDDSPLGLGLEKGLLITSGAAVNAIGPNNAGASSTINNGGTDEDLNTISTLYGNGSTSNDACIVELDVFVATDELTFEYIFGSEEYPEFSVSTFNDIFAFLVSGPGITGDPALNNQLNIATLPDGNNTLIQIASVNQETNWEYYRNNSNTAPNNLLNQTVQYDGLTSDFLGVKKSLTARADVTPCNTYHLKLAVADRGDSSFDSGVFISELKGGTPSIGVQYFSGIDYLVEDCTAIPDNVTISLGTIQEDDTSFDIVIGGTATLGVDYTLDIPSTITIPAGTGEISFPIMPLSDGITEGTETIEIQLTNNFGCGTVVFSTVVINLEDALEVEIFAGEDTVFVCQNGCAGLVAEGAQNYVWSPASAGFDDNFSQTPEICPSESQFINVLGTLGVCSDRDTIWIQIIDPELEIVPLGITDFCQGDSVMLQASNNVGNSNLQWTPATAITPNPNTQTVTVKPLQNTAYIATVSLAGCMAADTLMVNVDEFDFPELTTLDTFICQNYPVTLAAPINNTNTTYLWTSNPSDPSSIDCPTCPNPTVVPQVNTVYTLLATSENGYCDQTAQVNIEVAPADVDIQGLDTLQICLGDTINLTALTSTNGQGLLWTPDEGLSNNANEDVLAFPTETTTYYAILDVGECSVIDSVLIYVDSLPNLAITPIPDNESYCEGEEITLISPTYEPFDFPNIGFLWTPLDGQQTPDSNLNMVILAPAGETFYVRETTNRGCTSLDTILIVAVPSMLISIEPANSQICSDGEVQLMVIGDGPLNPDDITWSGDGLSCTDCLDPIASPNATTTYSVELDFMGCPVGASATVEILDPFFGQPAPQICFGESIVLNTQPDPNATYVWNGGTLVNDPSPQPTVSPTETTTYTVVVDNGACSITETVTISVIADYDLTVSENSTVCNDGPVTLVANAVDTNGDNVAGTFAWTLNGDPIANTNGTFEVNPPVGINTYEVSFTDNANCNTLSGTIVVEVLEAPAFEPPAITEICPGENVVLNQVSDNNSDYSWTGGIVSSDPQPTVAPTETTVYYLDATNGVCSITDSVVITVFNNYTLMPVDVNLCEGDPSMVSISANAEFADGTPVEGTYTWTDSNGNVIGNGNPIDVDASLGENVYMVEFVDANNCGTLNDMVIVTVNEIPDLQTLIATTGEDNMQLDTLMEGQTFTLVALPNLVGGTYTFTDFVTGDTSVNVNNITLIAPDVPGNDPFTNILATYQVTYVENGCEITVPLEILVENNPVQVPNAFTPNGDDQNNVFTLTGFPVELMEFRIYNRWGNTVYEVRDGKSDTDGWNGGEDNDLSKPAPADVYIYYIKYRINNNEPVIVKGDVTLIR